MSETPPSSARLDAGALSTTRARRPAAVTILAALQLLSATVLGLIFAGLLAGGPAALEALIAGGSDGHGWDITVATWVITILVGTLAVAELAAGVLLLRMRQLGWTLTMLLAGLGLATSLYLWWSTGTTLSFWVMVQIVTVFYLNQRQVRVAFGISRRRASDTFDETRG